MRGGGRLKFVQKFIQFGTAILPWVIKVVIEIAVYVIVAISETRCFVSLLFGKEGNYFLKWLHCQEGWGRLAGYKRNRKKIIETFIYWFSFYSNSLVFKGRRILIEKSDDGHARVVVLYRQVAQSDELLDNVSLPSKSSFLPISYIGRVPLVCCVCT